MGSSGMGITVMSRLWLCCLVLLATTACMRSSSSTAETAPATATEDRAESRAVAAAATETRSRTPEPVTAAQVLQPTPVAAVNAVAPDTGSAAVPVYADELAPEWQNWSWNTTVDFADTAPIAGAAEARSAATTAVDNTAVDKAAVDKAAIAVTHDVAWAGFRLHREDLIAAREVDLLRFRIHGGSSGGQQVRVVVADGSNALQEQGVTITAVADQWTPVEINVRELGNVAQISGIVWQDATGSAQPTYYLDNIALVDINLPPTATPVPIAGPVLTVDVSTPLHTIDPNIYGVNFADETLATDLDLPVRRWGGNGTTRYNWRLDTASHTSDWFFENIPKENPNPEQLPFGSHADQFVAQDRRTGTKSLLTMPMIGWTPKSRDYACGFSVAKYGPQQVTDPWRPDCGNGITPEGAFITGNDPTDTSMPIDERFVVEWMQHLIGQFGPAAAGGVAYYSLDNEPMLWHETHRDVHPEPLSYDELRELTVRYAATIKRVDPTAQTVGPALWGWTAYSYSALDQAAGGQWWNRAPDRSAHADVPLVPWYLQQLQAHEASTGVRLLDYLDLHYYPQAEGVALSSAGNAATQALRLQSTRSLWDPTYRDQSWIGEAVQLIPRMRQWVAANYPGTKLAITEYNWGALDHINGALAQADILGIFGREGLDMAMLWDPAPANAPYAHAFRIYRNYDGTGGKFGELSLAAESSDQERLAIYAAKREADGAVTVVIINKSAATLRSSVQFQALPTTAITAQSSVERYQYSADDLTGIVRQPDQTVATLEAAEFPGFSITLLVISQR